MTEQFRVASTFVEQMIEKRNKNIEKYLENIINSASTINRIIKYYSIGFSEDYSEMYLLFQDKIIRRYGISKEDYYRELRMEIWSQSMITIHEPTLIAPNIPK